MDEKIIELMARSDADFDGRPFDALGRADSERYLDRARKSVVAVQAAGFVIVPSEPTRQIIEEGEFALHRTIGFNYDGDGMEVAGNLYRAMLAAAQPSPSTETQR